MRAIVLVVADTDVGRLGHRRSLRVPLAGRPVLEHTLRRAARVEGVDRVVVVHPPGQTPLDGVETSGLSRPVETFAHPDAAGDGYTPRRRAARTWALTGWRGGLGGATAWDELLPATPLHAAAQAADAQAVVLVGGDWCLFDPGYAGELLRLHREAPDAMRLTFTQAPPGLGAVVTSTDVLGDLAAKHATIGGALAYQPHRPAIDPIGRECNLPIPASVRDTARRFIYDAPPGSAVSVGGVSLVEGVAERLGDAVFDADAVAVTDAARAWEASRPERVFDTLPEQVTIELTPRRLATGPIVPQHDVELPRGDMDPALAVEVVKQCAGRAVTLGGLGDATLHPDYAAVVDAAAGAGVVGLHVETDLLAERDALAPLTELPIDVVSVRLNADTAATYAEVMGVDRLPEVMATLQWLFDRRSAGFRGSGRPAGMPWVVPRLVKTSATLGDLETFFERWMQVVGHAVIERPLTLGRAEDALMPDLSPVPMDPPPRKPRKPRNSPSLDDPLLVKRRLTVLSDGTVALCGQDALGRAALGNVRDRPLAELWAGVPDLDLPAMGGPARGVTCRRCYEWWSTVAGRVSSAPPA
ncbi:MAG: SPASM domain-containing protein [Planctomycetota bacterium]